MGDPIPLTAAEPPKNIAMAWSVLSLKIPVFHGNRRRCRCPKMWTKLQAKLLGDAAKFFFRDPGSLMGHGKS